MKLCVPIKRNKINAVLGEMKKAQKHCDVIEIWLDEIKDLNAKSLNEINKINSLPLLYKVTKPDLAKIKQLLKNIKNIAYLDLDIYCDTSIIKKIKKAFPQIKIIISYHDFKKTPSEKELNRIIQKMIFLQADILKIATHARKVEDSLRILALLSHIGKQQKAIFLCMGKHGRITRTTGHLFGNYLMYAPMRAAHFTALGQLTISELKKILQSIN
ncbi:type I 3-dehydroquinate dehydratase [Candidatus Peregrinibacteria bacterium]|nr:type I 3-dehydroquinate dehydratase [Candidatus Peregrinibacteria bacterium]